MKKLKNDGLIVVEDDLFMVGIGSSAGGIEALSLLVKHLPENLNCVYVIAQHLSPSYKSILHEILNRESKLLVKKVTDGEKPKKNTVYVVPPNKNLIIRNRTFVLEHPSKELFNKPSINVLFESIAHEYGENAIGIILSGTGTDGTRGITSIKAHGGITFAQIPRSAKYDGMPSSAIDSGSVDFEIIPEEFGEIITRYLVSNENIAELIEKDRPSNEFDTLLRKVKLKTGMDFSNYKRATLLRRLQRRMAAVEQESLKKYLIYVDENEEELSLFAKDTLISVTSFFRDMEAFEGFTRCIKEIVSSKKNGEEVRVWVAGCATGEEAYSIAILFLDQLELVGKVCKLQVFATDIDMHALAIARQGNYFGNGINDIKTEYLEKYFKPKDGHFEVSKRLRDSVIFAKQDLTYDPPFLKLDLITCRNVLIYFNNDLQLRVLGMFHYALLNEGFLFLGRSESVGVSSDIFTSVDAKTRIYKKDPKVMLSLKRRGTRNFQKPSTESTFGSRVWEKLIQEEVSSYFESAAVIIDSELNVIHTFGQIGSFVSIPTGSLKYNLQSLIIEPFKTDLVPLFNVVKKNQQVRKSKEKQLESGYYRLVIQPSKDKNKDIYTVIFEKVEPEMQKVQRSLELSASAFEHSHDQLVNEEYLQSLIEEMSTANEEMQALNEEIQASYEEMQATNEELEASNEELQATNEELASVNEELLVKSNELATTTFEFESVYNTVDFPLLVLDVELNLKRFNKTAEKLYDLPYTAIGQPFELMHLPHYIKEVEPLLVKAINKKQKEIISLNHEKNSYKIFLTPSFTKTGKAIGIVLAVVDNTDIIQAKKEVEVKQEMMLMIMNHSSNLMALKDITGRYEFVNRRFEDFFALTLDEIVQKNDMQLFEQPIANEFVLEDLKAISEGVPKEVVQKIIWQSKECWLKIKRLPIFDEHGTLQSLLIELNDVTMSNQAEKKLKLSSKVFNSSSEGIMITDHNNVILSVNEAFTHITGYSFEDVVGKNPRILNSKIHPDSFFTSMWNSIMETGGWQGEIYNKTKEGEVFPEWLTINVVKEDKSITNFVGVFTDISNIKKSQNKIEHMATHDTLTGLPNRFLFVDTLNALIKTKTPLSVLFIDLDEFKTINDSLGHTIGDELLIEVAHRLKSCIGTLDFIARLGGDEFTIILHTADKEFISVCAQRILETITASYFIDHKILHVSCSIGVGIYPIDGTQSSELLRSADTAMYRAKELGKRQCVFFENEMKILSLQRMSIETGLRVALEKDYFEMVFQPKVRMDTQEIIGAEALLRWNDPKLGNISPSLFIPIAEKTGLMDLLGRMVIEKTMMCIEMLKDEDISFPSIAINISAIQFKNHAFSDHLLQHMSQRKISHNRIVLEITESLLMDATPYTIETLKALHAEGIGISVDDFGTGYSSLSYLKKLPLSELKIDKSFIDDLELMQDDYHITYAIMHIANALGIDVVAEGVENEEQQKILETLGCTTAQGYFYYHPLSFKEFKKTLKKQQKNF